MKDEDLSLLGFFVHRGKVFHQQAVNEDVFVIHAAELNRVTDWFHRFLGQEVFDDVGRNPTPIPSPNGYIWRGVHSSWDAEGRSELVTVIIGF